MLFVAFDREELGLLGSKAMVEAIPKDQIQNYCAMINLDSFGLATTPFALEGSSSKTLIDLSRRVSSEMKIPFANIRINGADSDSSSFLRNKIPAVTLSALSRDWQSVLHTGSDQAKKINFTSVFLAYRLALGVWGRVEETPCSAYR